MTDDRADVARSCTASFDGNSAQLLNEGPAGRVESVHLVGLDRDVARERPWSRRDRDDQHGCRTVAQKGVRDEDYPGTNEAGLGTDRRSEIDENDVARVQLSAQVSVEPRVPLGDEPSPLVRLRPKGQLGVGHPSVEVVATRIAEQSFE